MSAGPSLSVRTADPTPPYEQLRRQLVSLIESGVLAPDDRLPPLRQLARDLGLAVGTVARAYRELEAAGLVTSRRGGGTRVQRTTVRLSAADLRAALDDHARAFIHHAALIGASDDEARAALERALDGARRRTLGP